MQAFDANWLVLAAVALVALLIAWWLLRRAARPAPRARTPDVLDEGAAPAQRNQALIDSPIAATIVPPTTASATGVDTMGGMGEVIAASAPGGNAEADAWEATERAEHPVPVGDLARLKGVGAKLVAALGSLGVTRIDQVAAWTDADIDRIDAQLGPFTGRIRRDAWVEQARLLTSGDTAAYEAKFGKL